MKSSDENAPPYLENRGLLLLVVVSLALGWILLPFYGAILWGAIIALLFTPLYRRLLPRQSPTAALIDLIVRCRLCRQTPVGQCLRPLTHR